MPKYYTDYLSAEGVLKTIVADGIELSYEKVIQQRNDWHRWAKSWLEHNAKEETTETPEPGGDGSS